MFRNHPDELQEAFKILTKIYGKIWTVTSPFEIKNHTITFIADSYYDPILTLLALAEQGIIDASTSYVRSEQDKMVITGCNIEILRKLSMQWPDYKSVETVLEKISYKKPIQAEEKNSNEGDIIIEGGESGTVISRELWNEYWKCQGKEAPTSGWEIPTMQQIYETISLKSKRPVSYFFSVPSKLSTECDTSKNKEKTGIMTKTLETVSNTDVGSPGGASSPFPSAPCGPNPF